MAQLKVVSWNIWGGVYLQEIIDVLKTLDADVICLQEVLEDEDGGNNVVGHIAKTLGYSYFFESVTLLTPSVSHLLQEHKIQENKKWGNAILCKFPAEENRVHLLSEKKKRTAIEVSLMLEGEMITILSTHLVFGAENADTRTEQIHKLLEVISEKKKVVLCGDFNAPITDTGVQGICNKLTVAKVEEQGGIDYIFVSPEIDVVSGGSFNTKASDHLPIYAILKV